MVKCFKWTFPQDIILKSEFWVLNSWHCWLWVAETCVQTDTGETRITKWMCPLSSQWKDTLQNSGWWL